MPDLDLGAVASLDLTGSCEMSGALGDAGQRLLAYMAWPNDPERRRQYLATIGAEVLADMHAKEPHHFAGYGLGEIDADSWAGIRKNVIEGMAAKYFHPHGGFGAVAAAPGISALQAELEANAPSWCATGQLLYTIRSIDRFHGDVRGGASVHKAVELLERFIKAEDAIKDRTRIMKAWARYKPVAHLCAAYTEAMAIAVMYRGAVEKDIMDGAPFFSGLGRTLAVARDYQNFMTTFVPQAQRTPLVPEESVLKVPAGLVLHELPASIGPLPDNMLSTLRSYRAPKQL